MTARSCPFRVVCEGMRLVSCRESARESMARAIAACTGGNCFGIFSRAGNDDQEEPR